MRIFNARHQETGEVTASRLGTQLAGALALLTCMLGLQSAHACDVAGKIVSVQGSVEVQRNSGETWKPGFLEDRLCEGDSIRVGAESRAALMLVNDAVLRMDQNTTMRLTDIVIDKGERSWLELIRGAVQSFSRKPRTFTINTPYLNGSIEGTEFIVRVTESETTLHVYEGTVVAENAQGKVAVPGGSSTEARSGEVPVLRQMLSPRDGVQWALYFPLLNLSDENPDLRRAFDMLVVGRVDEASAQVQEVIQGEPGNGEALSLLAMIHLLHGRREEALSTAQKAAAQSSDSATAMVLSYAWQANGNLAAAYASAKQSVALNESDAFAWARLAEMQASFAELDAALASAEKAVAINSNVSRTQTVLGFSRLLYADTSAAMPAFDKAIVLNSADPMPRLGKGLGLIRMGDLENGRRELEVAAGLDGNNGLIRSYLGKAYYEENRESLAAGQYDTAKALDPNDPTPYFYHALLLQNINQPVRALAEMNGAIERNDNRAVYRSRLLLDADLAARSAGMARIYSDLGFSELALVEGWKSVNLDPANFSAHRFLADSYAARPRHEIARVSELLQSQMLQPLNSTPIQPRLAESSLYLAGSGGPAALSFNEFNPLFQRDDISLQVSGLVGSNNTNSEEVVLSAIEGKVASSIGLSHFASDGWRENSSQDDDLASFFLQIALSPTASLQFEQRYRRSSYGDLLMRYLPEEYYSGQINEVWRSNTRIGGRLDMSPDSTLLASLQYQRSDTAQTDDDYPDAFISLVKLSLPEEAIALELQHLWRLSRLKLTSGFGSFDVNGTLSSRIDVDLPPPPDGPGPFTVEDAVETEVRHVNAYSYGNLEVLNNLTLTLGVSADAISGDFPGEDLHEFNPKFGLMWNLLKSTTVRIAAFRTIKRTLVTNQTLEPTQVAGFNQFFDDYNLSQVETVGGAIDQTFSSRLYGGIETVARDLTVPYLDFNQNPPLALDAEWEEKNHRAYLYWAPKNWLAMSAQYQYEITERAPEFSEGLEQLTTRRVPLELKLFIASGWTASLREIFVEQTGDIVRFSGLPESADDSFWLLDAALSYRLPARRGLLSVGANNILDEEFNYFDRDLNNASIQPDRFFYARVTWAL